MTIPEYRSFMIFIILPSVPKEFSLATSPFLQIVSKAFEKSTKQVHLESLDRSRLLNKFAET